MEMYELKEALFKIADETIRRSLENAGRESEYEANKLLKTVGKRCHIRLTIEYEDLPEGEQTTEETESVSVYTEMKEDV